MESLTKAYTTPLAVKAGSRVMKCQASNMAIMVADMHGPMRSSNEALGVPLGFQSGP
jgi:hypothetical protein